MTDEQPTTTYEQAREELADVVRRLEAGGRLPVRVDRSPEEPETT